MTTAQGDEIQDERSVLVVDDEPGHRLMVRAVLEDNGWRVAEAADGGSALRILRSGPAPDVVLLDMRLPDMDGLAILRSLRELRPGLPVVMLTAFGSVGSAVEAMKKGAYDYLTKPADNDELEAVLDKAWQYGQLLRENERLRGEIQSGPEIIGQGPAMRQLEELIEQVAPSEATVLILGESGTGKELVAERLHALSGRKNGTLVKVNCAALPADLLESELFGYVRGAFTGAVKDKPGRFQLAQGGTLFLDEIGELPLQLQPKLLRAIQERVVEPLGSVRSVETDVRIIAATNRDLRQEVREGRFREDLFFRLNVLELRIPPLRERLEDLPILTSYLLRKLGRKNRKEVRTVSPDFLEALSGHDWPGNVRELENVLERALILARADVLTPDLLPAHVREASLDREVLVERETRALQDSPEHSPVLAGPFDSSLDEAERQALVQALEAHDGHRERTADALGISRRTLQYKLKKHGLIRR
ncbi:sigma-54-dependent transcriptional regulator [Desulfocurvibacter africanus]|uniref:Two component, sigma54 specific, transcriptional regulator, Fis family n=1 Tax=Desulfocurvibacter africanus subsp. africanus str. Walvis Bay TaxID=690850 RepID=F3YXY3_DESAF|nr:sigma-54 dependent transcriptional regulator [Desulfocurvibacter africanus]EGJ50685.1 two component, sigma54 specific, transcriptional regulator, Fis family [Desulfocurvibacter africanus subsp. africanus str. Walvis Bay]